MNDHAPGSTDLASKIAILVAEKGWNQEDFAHITGLNRHTVRQILQPGGSRRLRNATVAACARALELSVNDLRTQPLDRLLARLQRPSPLANGAEPQRLLYDLATQPELRAWAERNPQRWQQLTPEEIDELLSLQGTGGPLTAFGVENFVQQIERKRQLVQQVSAIANTEYLDLLEQLVTLIYERVQPYAERR